MTNFSYRTFSVAFCTLVPLFNDEVSWGIIMTCARSLSQTLFRLHGRVEEVRSFLTGDKRITKVLSSHSSTLEEEGAGKCLKQELVAAKRQK